MDSNLIIEIVGLVLIVCWVAKVVGLQTKFIPLLAIVLGGAGAYFFGGGELLATLYGVLTGIATTLGYREVKASIQ